MSRTRHVRSRRARTPDPWGNTYTSAKKPDAGRRWVRRFLKRHDIQPAREQRAPDVNGDE